MTGKKYFGIFWVYLPVIFFILGLQAVIVECTQQTQKSRCVSLCFEQKPDYKSSYLKIKKKGKHFSKCLQLA